MQSSYVPYRVVPDYSATTVSATALSAAAVSAATVSAATVSVATLSESAQQACSVLLPQDAKDTATMAANTNANFFITPYSQNASFFYEKCKLFYKSLIDRLKRCAFRMAQALCLCAFCTIFAACITSQARKPPTLPWGANSISPRRAPWVASSRRLV